MTETTTFVEIDGRIVQVLSREFLLERGVCCDRGCFLCPYGDEDNSDCVVGYWGIEE